MGALRIERTRIISPDVMVAELGGAIQTEVQVVKEKGKFYVKAPESLGGKIESVPADTLTDCINYKTWEWNEEFKKKERAARKAAQEKAS